MFYDQPGVIFLLRSLGVPIENEPFCWLSLQPCIPTSVDKTNNV